MNRVIEKQRIRRLAKVHGAMWFIGWIWGSLIACAITVALLTFLLRMVLG